MSTATPPPAHPGPHRQHAGAEGPVLAVVTAVLGALTLVGEWPHTDARLLAVDVGTLALSTALMPLVSRHRLIGAAAQALLAALSPTGTPGSTISTVQVAWRVPFRPAAALAAAGATAHLLRWLWRPYPGLTFGWWVVVVLAVYAALFGWGAQARARERLIGSLSERARRAEEEQAQRIAEARTQERTQIAREMHDVLAHRLSLLATYAGALEYRPDAPEAQRVEAAGVIRSSVHQALEDLREVIAVLRDDPAEDTGEGGTRPQPTLADVPDLVAECTRAGMQITVTDQTEEAPPSTISRAGYRIVQEGLTNARKHAPGAPVDLTLAGSAGTGWLTVTMQNPLTSDGGAHLPSSGMGLVGLAERARLVGGRLAHRARPDGFTLEARLPWG